MSLFKENRSVAPAAHLRAIVLAAALVAALPCPVMAATATATAPPQSAPPQPAPSLVVCVDPANMPYSSRSQAGFENRIAALLAADLHRDLHSFWFAEHKTFIRRTLNAGACDVVVSVPVGLASVITTKAYFASTYVAVMRADDPRHFVSFDDSWLRDARIGVQLVGNEGATTAPVVALSSRGITQHITAFEMWSGDETANPQGRIVDAVAAGDVDVALVWGPFAGYFAKAHGTALRIEPITGDPRNPDVAFVFPMALGVRKADIALRDTLQAALDRHRADIAAILDDDAIPLVPVAAALPDGAPDPPPSGR